MFADGWAGPDAVDLTQGTAARRSASGSSSAAACSTRMPARCRDARRAMAVQRRRPLPPPGRPARRPARSEFRRRRPGPDRRARRLPLSDYQARRLSRGATPTIRGARRTSISASLARLLPPLITQMYFPGDPLLAFDAIYLGTADESSARTADLGLRPKPQRGGMGPRLPFRHRVARSRGDADGEPVTWPTSWSRPRRRPSGRFSTWRSTAPSGPTSPRTTRTASASSIAGRVTDGDGAAVARRLSRSVASNAAGRYTHPDDTRTDKPLDPHFRGFGRVATDADGDFRLTTIRPGPVPAAATRCRRRTSQWRCSRAAC